MRQIALALISGVVGALLVQNFFAPSYAMNSSERFDAAVAAGRCTVTLKPSYVAYHFCDIGDVQTGTYNDSIYCAGIMVTCQ